MILKSRKYIIGLLFLSTTCLIASDLEIKKEPQRSASVKKNNKPAKAIAKKTDKKTTVSKKNKNNPTVDVNVSDAEKQKINPVVVCNKIAIRIPTAAVGEGKDIVITEQMLKTPSIDGRLRTEEELILDYLIFDQAVYVYHMPPAIKEAEQYLEYLKNQHGSKQLEQLVKESGRSYQEILDELIMVYTNRSFMSNLIASKVLVTEAEIKKYYNDHPEEIPTSYKIEKSFIEKDSVSKEAIDNLRKYGLGQDNVIWQPAYWIDEDDLADSKKFITKMHEGVVKVIDAADENAWEVIRLVKKVEKHTRSLEERSREITEKLQYAKFEEKLAEFKKDLLKKYTIVHL